MKVILTIILLLVSMTVFAPEWRVLWVESPTGIDPYKALKYAIGKVEVGERMDTLSINPIEQAYGYFQIRQVRLDDYRKRTGISYTLVDMLDYQKAERVFMHYAAEIGYKDPGKIARNWNGSGPKTWIYWDKVKKYL